MSFSLLTLGAGQEVGRSCMVVNINGVRVMFDCGVNMVFNDHRKFPDFRIIENKQPTSFDKNIYTNLTNTKDCDFNSTIDLVIISHFHLDHCGALPYFTEICNYSGPILATQPTKAIFPVTLEDFRRVISDMKGEKSLITNEDIQRCMRKIKTLELNEEIIINNKIKVTCYYAGHVLGAAMFHIEHNNYSVTYTGDYNTTVDRHLNSAFLPKLNQNILITETTYGSTIRDTKRTREREFIKKVMDVLNNRGKVLIPIFALGRAQEICILLDTHWKRNKIKVPIYFYGAMSEKSNFYYKIFNNWTNERVKHLFLDHNVFNFNNISSNTQSKQNEAYKTPDTPMVILSTPGMLHGGMSLNIFKEICSDEKNCVIIPGYCTSGTVGHKILSGEKNLEIEKKMYTVNCEIYYMSFSAHADAKGLLHLIKNSHPKNLVLVHGDSEVMKVFSKSVNSLLPDINTFMPENFKMVVFNEGFIFRPIRLRKEIFNVVYSMFDHEDKLILCKKSSSKSDGKSILFNMIQKAILDSKKAIHIGSKTLKTNDKFKKNSNSKRKDSNDEENSEIVLNTFNLLSQNKCKSKFDNKDEVNKRKIIINNTIMIDINYNGFIDKAYRNKDSILEGISNLYISNSSRNNANDNTTINVNTISNTYNLDINDEEKLLLNIFSVFLFKWFPKEGLFLNKLVYNSTSTGNSEDYNDSIYKTTDFKIKMMKKENKIRIYWKCYLDNKESMLIKDNVYVLIKKLDLFLKAFTIA